MSDAAATSGDAQSDAGQADKEQRKARLSQEDVPGYPLDQALKVAQTLADNYAYKPTRPISVAEAMSMAPTGRGFRGVTGAAVAYGLTTAAYNSPEIGLTPIGMRIVRPTTEGDDLAAKREALLKPRVIGEFLRHFDGAALPADHIGRNVLIDKAVPADRATEVFNLIVEGATQVGFIREWNGKRYVDLAGSQSSDGDVDSDSSPNRSRASRGCGGEARDSSLDSHTHRTCPDRLDVVRRQHQHRDSYRRGCEHSDHRRHLPQHAAVRAEA